MKLYEMEGFLRGKCIPGDMKVNETNAEYLVRKFSEVDSEITHLKKKLSVINSLMDAAEQAIKLAQEATEKLVQERNALAAENAGLKEALEYVINPNNQPEYHDQGMGCGVEDHGYQRDGYSACAYGWESAMERVYSEVIPDAIPETPATSAFLAEVRASAVDEVCLKISNAIINCHQDEQVGLDEAATICGDFASEIRKGVQS